LNFDILFGFCAVLVLKQLELLVLRLTFGCFLLTLRLLDDLNLLLVLLLDVVILKTAHLVVELGVTAHLRLDYV
jgi:hypothetical protein